jgi:hypothetical protein
MAIRIPILTSFDPKGLKQANAQFAKLQTSIGSLGRNFAIAGTAIVAGTALLGKAVQSASNFEAEFEGVNQVFGDAAKSVQRFAEQAAQSAGLSATEALQASKTFGLFATGAGLGAAEAAKFSTTMVQLAGDLGSFNDVPTAEALAAIQSGLMGQSEPLRKFGVFLDDARLKAEALNMGIYNGTGPLTTQQKMMASYSAILAQTTIQQGDFVKYQDTLGNQLKTISTEFDNLSKDIGLMLIPAITDALPEIKELARSLGEELKAAIESVDWKALTKTIVDLARFFAENAGTIIQVVTAIFALNTAYKLMQIAIGLTNVALALNKWWLAQTATGMTIATVATNVFSSALKLIPFVAVIAGIGLIVAGMTEADSSYRTTTPVVTSFGEEMLKTGHDAEWAAGKYGIAKDAVNGLSSAISSMPTIGKISIGNVGGGRGLDLSGIPKTVDDPAAAAALAAALAAANGATGKTGGSSATASPLQQIINDSKKNATVLKKQSTLERKGLSAEVAAWVTSSSKPVKAANQAIQRITKNGTKAIGNLTKAYNNSAAGQAAAAAASANEITESFTAVYDDTADKEAAALAERERVFASFADSVRSTFASMKNGIINAFDLTELGGSSNAITRNMDKLLTRLRAFATNVKSLASMGLNPALLQQVISAGPMGGARLAEALVMGGAGGLSAINAGYSEFGALSSQIAQTGTESLFNREAQQTVYNINVDGGVGSGSTIGKAIVDAIKAYERTSGAVWQGA